jgi:hypothetical protein
MALSFRTSAAGGGTSGTVDRTVTITPAVGDLFVVFCNVSGNTNASPTCSDNNGGTYDLVLTALKNSSADTLSVFVRRTALPNTTSTVITVATGSNTAGEIIVIAYSGSLRYGSSAIRSKGSQANQASGGTPAPALNIAALTGNPTITCVANGTAGGSVIVPNASWTERQDVSQSTPTTGIEAATRDSGFTGTTITQGGTSSTAFASAAVELDSTNQTDDEDWYGETYLRSVVPGIVAGGASAAALGALLGQQLATTTWEEYPTPPATPFGPDDDGLALAAMPRPQPAMSYQPLPIVDLEEVPAGSLYPPIEEDPWTPPLVPPQPQARMITDSGDEVVVVTSAVVDDDPPPPVVPPPQLLALPPRWVDDEVGVTAAAVVDDDAPAPMPLPQRAPAPQQLPMDGDQAPSIAVGEDQAYAPWPRAQALPPVRPLTGDDATVLVVVDDEPAPTLLMQITTHRPSMVTQPADEISVVVAVAVEDIERAPIAPPQVALASPRVITGDDVLSVMADLEEPSPPRVLPRATTAVVLMPPSSDDPVLLALALDDEAAPFWKPWQPAWPLPLPTLEDWLPSGALSASGARWTLEAELPTAGFALEADATDARFDVAAEASTVSWSLEEPMPFLGDVVPIKGKLSKVSGPVSGGEVFASIRAPDGAVTLIQGVDITEPEVGTYTFSFSATQKGPWLIRMWSTGANQAGSPTITVLVN